MGFVKNDNANFSIEAKGLETFATGTEIWLQDLKTGAQQKLNDNPVYSFTSVPGDEVNRFKLKFGGTFSINESSASPFSIYAGNGIIYVNKSDNKTFKGTITVYSVTGQEVMSQELRAVSLQKLGFNGKAGCNIVRIITGPGHIESAVHHGGEDLRIAKENKPGQAQDESDNKEGDPDVI